MYIWQLLLLSHAAYALLGRDRVKLSSIKTLTLSDGRMTSFRRTAPVPQLKCVGGDGCKAGYRAETLQCRNMGGSYSDPEDVQWACEGIVPDEVRLGRTDVVCEGYDGPDDEYILRGSCGVEYTLYLTDVGLRNAESNGFGARLAAFGSRVMAFCFGNPIQALVLAFFAYIFITSLWPSRSGPRNRAGGYGFGGGGPGGGGGGGGGVPPPPPYDDYPSYSKPSSSQSWTPGLFSGLAAGAAAGYAMGRGGGSERSSEPGPSRVTRSQRSSPPSTSSSHVSTGFGETRRR